MPRKADRERDRDAAASQRAYRCALCKTPLQRDTHHTCRKCQTCGTLLEPKHAHACELDPDVAAIAADIEQQIAHAAPDYPPGTR
jgi:DNA-directed RNA polymerase subunit RPC12/RpoP